MRGREEIENNIEALREDIKKAHEQYVNDEFSKKMFMSIKWNHQAKIEALKWVLEGADNE